MDNEISLWLAAGLVAVYLSHLWLNWLPPEVAEYLEDAGDDYVDWMSGETTIDRRGALTSHCQVQT